MIKDITVYTASFCGYCTQAKALLKREGLAFEEINLDDKPELRQKLSAENNGYRTVPMIFINGKFLGGYNELVQWQREGRLAGGLT